MILCWNATIRRYWKMATAMGSSSYLMATLHDGVTQLHSRTMLSLPQLAMTWRWWQKSMSVTEPNMNTRTLCNGNCCCWWFLLLFLQIFICCKRCIFGQGGSNNWVISRVPSDANQIGSLHRKWIPLVSVSLGKNQNVTKNLLNPCSKAGP